MGKPLTPLRSVRGSSHMFVFSRRAVLGRTQAVRILLALATPDVGVDRFTGTGEGHARKQDERGDGFWQMEDERSHRCILQRQAYSRRRKIKKRSDLIRRS